MPELPEIMLRAQELDREMAGRFIADVHICQPKSLNVPVDEFRSRLVGSQVGASHHRGKWVYTQVGDEWLLTNLGMGGEILLHSPGQELPEKVQAVFELDGGWRLSVHFRWFGYLHLAPDGDLEKHTATASLGPNALSPELTEERLTEIITPRRARIKTLLLDQSCIAGVGNMYSHDILFQAGLHPLRPANTLSPEEIGALWRAMRSVLQRAVDLGGARWEIDIHGRPGRFSEEHLMVGYRAGQPCTQCGATIEKIKTGGTSSFICPACQPKTPAHGDPAAR